MQLVQCLESLEYKTTPVHWRFVPWEAYVNTLHTVSDRTDAVYAVFEMTVDTYEKIILSSK